MTAVRNMLRWGKNLVVPGGKKFRTIRFGLAAGCEMQLDLRTDFMLYLGQYEKELARHFHRLVRQGYNCFDVGGKGGYYALILGKLTGARIVSFECNSDAIKEMRQTFARNSYSIQTIEGFVGELDIDNKVTLDSVASQTFVPDFIKMDIEGGEANALLGAIRILSDRKPSLIIEVHGRDIEDKCLEILTKHGYSPQVQGQRGSLKETRPLDHNRWLICEGRP